MMNLENKKRTFRLLEEIIGKCGDRIIITVSMPKSMTLQAMASAYWVLNNLEHVRNYTRYSEIMCGTYIDFDLDDTFMVCVSLKDTVDTEPYYHVSIEAFGGIRPDDDEIVDMHRIHRKNGYTGKWVDGPIKSHYLYKK